MDLPKAFAHVPHERLFYKLHWYGVRGHLYQWIHAFLMGCSKLFSMVPLLQLFQLSQESYKSQCWAPYCSLFMLYTIQVHILMIVEKRIHTSFLTAVIFIVGNQLWTGDFDGC